MSRLLALLSGKGGSGKTTLALSMSSLLANCGIKVLLVDCDLSTNGATYFYEKKLSNETNKKIISIEEICKNEISNSFELNVKENLYFIPSITSINQDNNSSYLNGLLQDNAVKKYFLEARQRYDIIIFDCQAGYTVLLDSILKLTDCNLVVMEADAISSASVRSLYLKIGNIINNKSSFQIFNKVTKDEDEIYSKISGGTFFTNIGTIIFDWKVRKSFAIATIPDMENTSADYGEKVFELCSILFSEKEYEEYLCTFKDKLEYHRNVEMLKNLENDWNELKLIRKNTYSNRFSKYLILPTLITMMLALVTATFYESDINLFFESKILATLLVLLLTVAMCLFMLLELTSEKRINRRNKEVLLEKIEITNANIMNIKTKIESNNNKTKYLKF